MKSQVGYQHHHLLTVTELYPPIMRVDYCSELLPHTFAMCIFVCLYVLSLHIFPCQNSLVPNTDNFFARFVCWLSNNHPSKSPLRLFCWHLRLQKGWLLGGSPAFADRCLVQGPGPQRGMLQPRPSRLPSRGGSAEATAARAPELGTCTCCNLVGQAAMVNHDAPLNG